MVSFIKRRRRHLDINITSLIDVIFMLLIFFMIASHFDTPVISVQLPTASSGIAGAPQTIELVLDKEGRLFWEGKMVYIFTLEKLLSEKGTRTPDATIALSCDENVPYKRVIEVLGILQKSGFSRVALRHTFIPPESHAIR